MAALAIGSQLPRMTVLVTRQTRRMESLKSAVKVLDHDPFAIRLRDVSRVVALRAGQPGMPP